MPIFFKCLLYFETQVNFLSRWYINDRKLLEYTLKAEAIYMVINYFLISQRKSLYVSYYYR